MTSHRSTAPLATPLKILIVCSGNKNRINSFIQEQSAALQEQQVRTTFFFIQGKGISGYLRNYFRLRKMIKAEGIDIVHAHYGLSGLLAVLQRTAPVVVTFHGSDVNQRKTQLLSRIAAALSSHNILVEESFVRKLNLKKNYTVLPCGVDLVNFYPCDKNKARAQLSIDPAEKIVLFSSAFDNRIKNYPLARASVEKVPGARLVELKGYSRSEIHLLMNAANLLLVTSFSEGSPQVVKEALSCNLPVISTAVGDVPELLQDVEPSFIVDYDSVSIARAIKHLTAREKRSNGRMVAYKLDNKLIATKIIDIYQSVRK